MILLFAKYVEDETILLMTVSFAMITLMDQNPKPKQQRITQMTLNSILASIS